MRYATDGRLGDAALRLAATIDNAIPNNTQQTRP
jgi:hypothetical protein